MAQYTQATSNANRTHIGIFGRVNAGKSSLVNLITKQSASIVSSLPGTTTDVVKKPIEIHGIGACILLDTAGLDDQTPLRKERLEKTYEALEQTDIAFLLFSQHDSSVEEDFLTKIKAKNIPVIGIISHSDELSEEVREEKVTQLENKLHIPFVAISMLSGWGLPTLRDLLIQIATGTQTKRNMCDGLVKKGDTVILVMPQDAEAPVGRLIQPQVMAIRDLLDKHCKIISVATEEFEEALNNCKALPQLVIVDSQVFHTIAPLVPKGVKLTSFSILMAGLKGDIRYYAQSAKAIEILTETSKVLIAECCTHAPIEEDIGRVKIPNLLRKKIGPGLQIDVKAGTDFPIDASKYDLIIQCGGCMFNRRYIMNRINHAKYANVPMTNYGIAIAYLNGILNQVTLPQEEVYGRN